MDYFNDLAFRCVIHHRFGNGGQEPFHPSANSLEFLRNGHLVWVNRGVRCQLHAPVVFWMRKNEEYRFITDNDPKNVCEHIYCDFSGPRTKRIIDSLEKNVPDGFITPSDPSVVSDLFFELLKYYRLNKNYYHPEMVVCVEQLFLQLEASMRPLLHPQEDPYHIWVLADEIRKDPFSDFDFKSFAVKEGICLDHFRRLFRNAHKMSPVEFLRYQRMSRAAEMLSMTGMRIKEIVESCGFGTLIEFSRVFKRFSGMSPREYRQYYLRMDKR